MGGYGMLHTWSVEYFTIWLPQ